MENSSVLYEAAVPVQFKSASEDRQADLTIRIILVGHKHQLSSKIQVQITNELDPFFLHLFEANEEDFRSLKNEQGILVDFQAFPHKFIELLELCRAENPRFLALLTVRTGDSSLSVVEKNHFKHLSHLFLGFKEGKDSGIKTYLAWRVSVYKGISTELSGKLNRALESLENSVNDVHKLKSVNMELKETHSRVVSELTTKHTVDLAHEKEKAMQENVRLKEKAERDHAELHHHFRQRADTRDSHVAELDKQIRELTTVRFNLETKATELKSNIQTLEKELNERQQECEQLRRTNSSLDSKLNDGCKQLNHNATRVAILEQEVQDKNELLSDLSKQVQDCCSHRSSLELSLKDAQVETHRAEEKAVASTMEVSKCNQMIEKLQCDVRAYKSKAKLKGQVAAQQEILLQERQTTIEKNISDNRELRQEIKAMKSQNDFLREKMDETKAKLDEAQQGVKSNQQMIEWLNQQLTAAQLGKYRFSSRLKHLKRSEMMTLGNLAKTTSSLLSLTNSTSTSMTSRRKSPTSSPTHQRISKVVFKPPMQKQQNDSDSTSLNLRITSHTHTHSCHSYHSCPSCDSHQGDADAQDY